MFLPLVAWDQHWLWSSLYRLAGGRQVPQ